MFFIFSAYLFELDCEYNYDVTEEKSELNGRLLLNRSQTDQTGFVCMEYKIVPCFMFKDCKLFIEQK